MIHECPAHVSELRRESSRITYPGHYSPVEAGQLGVVVGNLFFDNPVKQTQAVRRSDQEKDTEWDTKWDTGRDTVGHRVGHGARGPRRASQSESV